MNYLDLLGYLSLFIIISSSIYKSNAMSKMQNTFKKGKEKSYFCWTYS